MLHSFCRVERTCQEAFRTSPRSTLEAASLESSTTRKCNKIWRDKVPSLHSAHHSAEEQQEKQNVSSRPMIFIYLGGGRSQLWLTLLGLAVTVLLNSGYLSNPSSYAVGPGGIDWSSGRRPVHDPWSADFAATPSLNLTWMVPAFALFAFASSKAYFSIRRQGLRNSWRELCHSVWNWRPAAAGEQAPSNTATSKRRRFEAVSKIVQQLPVELYVSETDLRKLPLPDLKKRLMSNGLNSKESLDKGEAVERILAAGNSSSTSCTVCCDDYESGDALRVLKCGHKYHVECIDKWLLSSTDYLRAPACPICSAALSTEEH